MNKPEEILNKVETLETYRTKNTVIDELLQIKDYIQVTNLDNISPDKLSKIALKLSVLLINLGDMTAKATLKANLHYSYRKFSHARDYKQLRELMKTTVTDADQTAQHMNQKNITDEIQAQYEADLLKTFYDDIDRLVITIQSRMKLLDHQMKQTNLQK